MISPDVSSPLGSYWSIGEANDDAESLLRRLGRCRRPRRWFSDAVPRLKGASPTTPTTKKSLVGGFKPWNGWFSVIFVEMSSFPLTNSIIFQDGYKTTNQNRVCSIDFHGGLMGIYVDYTTAISWRIQYISWQTWFQLAGFVNGRKRRHQHINWWIALAEHWGWAWSTKGHTRNITTKKDVDFIWYWYDITIVKGWII